MVKKLTVVSLDCKNSVFFEHVFFFADFFAFRQTIRGKIYSAKTVIVSAVSMSPPPGKGIKSKETQRFKPDAYRQRQQSYEEGKKFFSFFISRAEEGKIIFPLGIFSDSLTCVRG